MKIYLDIEGTLLGSNGYSAKCLEDFLEYATTHHECFWLTSHCRNGIDNTIKYLVFSGVSEPAVLSASKVKATNWSELKTEAINMKEDFVWFDDAPTSAELVALETNRKRNSLYLIDTKGNPYALCEALDWLTSLAEEE